MIKGTWKTFTDSSIGAFTCLTVTILLSHLPLLLVKRIENPDAGWIYRNLNQFKTPIDYLSALVNFETLDFQPVRDLTFFLDNLIFDQTGIVVSILFNCLIWAGACFLILKTLKERQVFQDSTTALLLVSCFAVYPIFEPAINWGVARKHLLAFLFILCATRSFFAWEKKDRTFIPVIAFYLLSVLSIPISIAWPAWVFFRLGHLKSLKDSRKRSLVTSLFFISLGVAAINFAYYKTSYTFLQIYPQKVEGFSFIIFLGNLGFQVKQIIFPYQLSLFYTFDSRFVVFSGLLFLALGILWYFKKHLIELNSWLVFAVLPMLVVLTTPHIYYDTYVIVPTFSMFMLITVNTKFYIQRYSRLLILPLFAWSTLTFQNSKLWSSPTKFYEMAMDLNPNCTNATVLGIRVYSIGEVLPNDLFEFIQTNECLNTKKISVSSVAIRALIFEAMTLYYEDSIDLAYRKKRLKQLGSRDMYLASIYLAFLAKTNQVQELEETTGGLNETLFGKETRFEYDPIFSGIVPRFCQKNMLTECLRFTKRWEMASKNEPYF